MLAADHAPSPLSDELHTRIRALALAASNGCPGCAAMMLAPVLADLLTDASWPAVPQPGLYRFSVAVGAAVGAELERRCVSERAACGGQA